MKDRQEDKDNSENRSKESSKPPNVIGPREGDEVYIPLKSWFKEGECPEPEKDWHVKGEILSTKVVKKRLQVKCKDDFGVTFTKMWKFWEKEADVKTSPEGIRIIKPWDEAWQMAGGEDHELVASMAECYGMEVNEEATSNSNSSGISNVPETPGSFEEAMKFPEWRESIKAELMGLKGKVKLVTRASIWGMGKKVLPVRYVFKTKRDKNGDIIKRKTRLVVKDIKKFSKESDVRDFYSHVARMDSVRILIAVSVQLGMLLFHIDFAQAFTQSKLEEDEHHIEIPPGFGTGGLRETHAWNLLYSLYGLRIAPKVWRETLTGFLNEIGFRELESDPSLFVRESIFLAVFVDDILIAASQDDVNKLQDELALRFKSEMEECQFFLGLEINRAGDSLKVSQGRYITKLLQEVNMWGVFPKQTPNFGPQRQPREHDEEKLVSLKAEMGSLEFKSHVGKILYLAVASRPDILEAIRALASHSGKLDDFIRIHRIYSYLRGTVHLGMVHRKESKPKVQAWVDASLGSGDHCRSISGWMIKYGGLIVARCKAQTCVALSSCEAELVAATSCATEVIHVRNVLSELGFGQLGSTPIFEDNTSAIRMCEVRGTNHHRNKHYSIKMSFLTGNPHFHFEHLSGDDHPADMLTKPLSQMQFRKHTKIMMGDEHFGRGAENLHDLVWVKQSKQASTEDTEGSGGEHAEAMEATVSSSESSSEPAACPICHVNGIEWSEWKEGSKFTSVLEHEEGSEKWMNIPTYGPQMNWEKHIFQNNANFVHVANKQYGHIQEKQPRVTFGSLDILMNTATIKAAEEARRQYETLNKEPTQGSHKQRKNLPWDLSHESGWPNTEVATELTHNGWIWENEEKSFEEGLENSHDNFKWHKEVDPSGRTEPQENPRAGEWCALSYSSDENAQVYDQSNEWRGGRDDLCDDWYESDDEVEFGLDWESSSCCNLPIGHTEGYSDNSEWGYESNDPRTTWDQPGNPTTEPDIDIKGYSNTPELVSSIPSEGQGESSNEGGSTFVIMGPELRRADEEPNSEGEQESTGEQFNTVQSEEDDTEEEWAWMADDWEPDLLDMKDEIRCINASPEEEASLERQNNKISQERGVSVHRALLGNGSKGCNPRNKQGGL